MLRIVVALCVVGAALCGPPVSRSRSEIQKFRDFLEGTRTENGVRISSMDPSRPEWEKSGKYQGDILLDEEQLESMVEQFAQGRNAYTWPGTLWPSRVVVYEFAAGHFTQAEREFILSTIQAIEQRTCIRFRQRNPGEFNYVLLTGYGDGCYANVGYWASRGIHIMNLTPSPIGWGCMNAIVIIHEWLHIIGFFHMQSTYDRDNYVRINWENIERGMEYNFDRIEPHLVSNLGLEYEYDSCMHYDAWAFSINGRTTMDALRPHNGVMGQTQYVTGVDFLRVDRHYGCAAWRKAEDYEPFYYERPAEATDEVVKVEATQAEEANKE